MASTVAYHPGYEFAAQFRVEEKLGSGLTGQVYRAVRLSDQQPVALKIMRKGLSDKLRAGFESEGMTLHQLRDAENARGDNLRLVPEWLGHDLQMPEPWLAMELVDSRAYQRLPSFLYESEQGRLDEPTALTIGWQLCRVLDLLHTCIGKTYTDLKLDNIWWNPTDQQIKVIDWNVVGEDMRGVANDLRLVGIYLYRMLVGAAVEERGDHIYKPDTPAGWKLISYGAREILRWQLSSVDAHRYQSARELGTALQTHADLWKQAGNQLLRNAAELLENDPNAPQTRRQAKLYLDLAHRRPPVLENVWQALWERVDTRAWEDAAQRFFYAGDYRAAREEFTEAIQESEHAEPLRWWAALTDAALQDRLAFESVKDESIGGVQDLLNENFDSAEEKFARAFAQSQIDLLDDLRQEAQLRALVSRARTAEKQGLVEQAIQFLREAHAQASAIGLDKEWVQALGDLQSDSKHLQLQQDVTQIISNGKELIAQNKLEAGLDLWTGALKTHPSAQILSAWTDLASEYLRGGDLKQARTCLERVFESGHSTPDLRQLWNLVYAIGEVDEDYQNHRLTQALAGFHSIIDRAPSADLVQRALEDLIDKIIRDAIIKNIDITFQLKQLADRHLDSSTVWSSIWKEKLAQWEKFQSDRANDEQQRLQRLEKQNRSRAEFLRQWHTERKFRAFARVFARGKLQPALERLQRYVSEVDSTESTRQRAAELIARVMHNIRDEDVAVYLPLIEKTLDALKLKTADLVKELMRLDFVPLRNATNAKDYTAICEYASRLLKIYSSNSDKRLEVGQVLKSALKQMEPSARPDFAGGLEKLLRKCSPDGEGFIADLHQQWEDARVERELSEIKRVLNDPTKSEVLEKTLDQAQLLATNQNSKIQASSELLGPLRKVFNRSTGEGRHDTSYRIQSILKELAPDDTDLHRALDEGIARQNEYLQAHINDTIAYAERVLGNLHDGKSPRINPKFSSDELKALIDKLQFARVVLASDDPRAEYIDRLSSIASRQGKCLADRQIAPTQRPGCLNLFGWLSSKMPPERLSNLQPNMVESAEDDWVIRARECLDRNPLRAQEIVEQGLPTTTRFPTDEQQRLKKQIQVRIQDHRPVASRLKKLGNMPIEERRNEIAQIRKNHPGYPWWKKIEHQIETVRPEDW